jgi:hypothetical protein
VVSAPIRLLPAANGQIIVSNNKIMVEETTNFSHIYACRQSHCKSNVLTTDPQRSHKSKDVEVFHIEDVSQIFNVVTVHTL